MKTDTRQAREKDRGQRATFDPRSGEVRGSGSGAGREAKDSEDYDGDSAGGRGLPSR